MYVKNANIEIYCLMENRQQQILSEIQEMMSSIRTQLEKLDAKMSEFQQSFDTEGVISAPIDIEIDDDYLSAEVVEQVELDIPESVAEPEPVVAPEHFVEPDPVEEPEPVVEPEQEVAPVVEPEPVEEVVTDHDPAVEPDQVAEEEPKEEPVVEDDDDDLPLFAEPESIFEAAQKATKPRKAMIDVMEDKEAWRTDMPGAPVRDVLSAISLNDRVQFINVLFDEDPSKFQQARARINSMNTLDEAVAYITSTFNWDMGSQVVYRFMMAVRRKVK